ncbi:30S ribosomal protein S13 [Candidatus Woesearchaeota archaeon CG10_big_fil_rev_8_21_14_0_10_45_16]|nr:MAG: 30S ribosomal protein S13 [Candidatus Woesearchaeota archaeon CG10_big_fil_rev_8_21_14_0_10_45_16]
MAEKQFRHIVRIANVDVPGEKTVRIALTKIKGVGINFADSICTLAGVKKTQKAGDLDDASISRLNEVIIKPKEAGLPIWMLNRREDYETGEDKHLLTGTLNFVQENDLKRLKKIKSLRGIRHQKGLPVRGQRTRSNFRRSKGKVVGVAKKKAPAKSGK